MRYSYMPWKTNRSMCLPVLPVLPTTRESAGTLVAIGVPKELLDSTLRFSFSEFTTKEQLDYTLEQLEKLLPVLRKFTRR